MKRLSRTARFGRRFGSISMIVLPVDHYRTTVRAVIDGTSKFNPLADCIVGKEEADGVAFTRVHPFWSDWSDTFLHSSDVVMACTPVWNQVISDGDAIATIDQLKFLSPMKSQLDVRVATLASDECINKLLVPARGKPAFLMSAHTRKQAKVGMVGYLTDAAVDRNRNWRNPFVLSIGDDFEDTTYQILGQGIARFTIPLASHQLVLDADSAMFSTALSMDVVMSIRQRLTMASAVPYYGAPLAAGFENFQIPPLTFFAVHDPVLTLTFDLSLLQEKPRVYMLPIGFEFINYDTGERAGGGTYNVAFAK